MDIRVLALPELSSMILAWIALLIIFLILRKFLYKPVAQTLDARKTKIQDEIHRSITLKEEALELKTNYEHMIQQAKDEGQEIIDGARLRGEELRQSILLEAREEAEVILSRAKKEIERQRQIAYAEMKAETGEMAILIASKIMEEKMTYESQKNLIDKFIDEVGNSKWQS